jgi:hypothetical protein
MSLSELLAGSLFGGGRRVKAARKLGPYIVGPKIGQGGMGAVYRGRHVAMKKPVAIKLLTTDRHDPRDVIRFEREIDVTSRLASPNTVAVYDCGRTAEGKPYYVMEYVDGFDLDQLVTTFGELRPARAIHLLEQLCCALAEVHSAGLVHCDVKPSNVAVSERAGVYDVVKLLDFGLAKDVGSSRRGTPRRDLNALAGTPGFFPPSRGDHGARYPRRTRRSLFGRRPRVLSRNGDRSVSRRRHRRDLQTASLLRARAAHVSFGRRGPLGPRGRDPPLPGEGPIRALRECGGASGRARYLRGGARLGRRRGRALVARASPILRNAHVKPENDSRQTRPAREERRTIMLSISEKVVAITGASSGIGEATARLLGRRGARVVLGARRTDRLERIAGDIRAYGGTAEIRELDVTKLDQVEAFMRFAKERFGASTWS